MALYTTLGGSLLEFWNYDVDNQSYKTTSSGCSDLLFPIFFCHFICPLTTCAPLFILHATVKIFSGTVKVMVDVKVITPPPIHQHVEASFTGTRVTYPWTVIQQMPDVNGQCMWREAAASSWGGFIFIFILQCLVLWRCAEANVVGLKCRDVYHDVQWSVLHCSPLIYRGGMGRPVRLYRKSWSFIIGQPQSGG